MKKYAILASLAGALMVSAYAGNTTNNTSTKAAAAVEAPAKARAYTVDVAKSNVKWHAKKVTGEHMGNIALHHGQMLLSGNKVVGGTFAIDMNSITCTDITDAEYNGKLIGHLKSDDFFSVGKHPMATFKINSVKPVANAAVGKPNYTVSGDLTIKGITKPISFPATITVKNGVATAKADVTIDRAKFDVRYGSNSFFEGLGDKAISDDFVVSLDVTAKQ
ncbi:polyisoprenoid-binding protein YceI [Pontibacter ummariensis]|uniref:Polyisoprenoid-binding protein YceI n=1 Tax=Pontibacter ummariensis TaxID=1610492 RepID=A0A239BGS5_9BACT|nr:YceI family protein [Pontibacter ummariensis]PRY16549.1 polyisoprenoid-binding protein YceI [Pontibacter ummariensis]SNS07140.1 Polyisoprenoid-binding protein YceI [Pontibacter ummariensis]